MINLNIKNVIFILVVIGVFIGIIYFIVKSFKSTCSNGYTFDKTLNKCIPVCPSAQINDPGTGDCVCPNKDDHYDSASNTCVRTCVAPFTLFCDDKCKDPNQFACIKGKLCSLNPDYTCGGTDCCDPNVSGTNTKCSNGKIIFLQDDFFTLKENNYEYIITIKQNFDGYNFTTTDSNYYCKIIQDLLNAASTSNKYTYAVSTKDPISSDDKTALLTIEVSNNNNFQPTLDFTKTKYPELFGFGNSSYQFSSNQLVSSDSIVLYKCNVLPCKDGEYPCGSDCCDEPDSCIDTTCCTKSRNKIICKDGTGNNVCCPIINGVSTCCPGSKEGCCPEGTTCHLNTKTNKYECMIQCVNDPNVWCDQMPSPSDPSQRTGQYCVDFTDWNGNKKSYCGHQDCVFDSITYTPSKIGTYDVCMDSITDPNNPRYYTNTKNINAAILTRTAESPYNQDYSKENSCGPDDCEKRMDEYGTVDVQPNLQTQKCDSTYRCDSVLDNQNTKDKLDNKCPPDASPYQCCNKSDGTYTGQICYSGNIALLNPDGKTCICEPIGTQNSKYCGGNGTTKLSSDGKSILCECNKTSDNKPDYAGNICQYSRSNRCNNHGYPDDNGKCTMDPPTQGQCYMEAKTRFVQGQSFCYETDNPNGCRNNLQISCPAGTTYDPNSKTGRDIDLGICSSGQFNFNCNWNNPHP
jgi:hypothetical protein